jgi:hypothetical protein
MSQTLVLAQVETMCEAITGVKSAHKGMPASMPDLITSYPMVVLDATPGSFEPYTFEASGTGKGWFRYDIFITLYLGAKDQQEQRAQAMMLPYPDRFRAKFAPDRTLGGLAWDAVLSEPRDNLPTFITAGEYPFVGWRLRVIENVQINAAAS